MRLLLLDPREFFTGLAREEVDLTRPGLIVLALGVLAGLSSVVSLGPLLQMMPEETSSISPLIIAISALTAVIITIILWIVFAGVFHVISLLFGGKGQFTRTLQVVGYGFFPQIIGSAISLPLLYDYISGLQIPPVSDPALIEEAVRELLSGPTMLVISVIGILFFLWSANLWIFGVKEARALTLRDAVITVGVPAVLYIFLQVYNLYGLMGV
ncbi:MAG: Yip1 family protein [Methanomicrobiaceae archaeon]|nr:Yip1 family protein [Methanomicrobiaceae archaeon]